MNKAGELDYFRGFYQQIVAERQLGKSYTMKIFTDDWFKKQGLYKMNKNYLEIIDNIICFAEVAYQKSCHIVLNNPKFVKWVASPDKHHSFEGGLLAHTAEVLQFCQFTASLNPRINKNILYTAAVWHDFGKIWDYEKNQTGFSKKITKDGSIQEWDYTEHKQKIHHISRSVLEFSKNSCSIPDIEKDEVIHCILAHHGDHASPRTPQTLEAWTLHLADCNSAFCLGGKLKEMSNLKPFENFIK